MTDWVKISDRLRGLLDLDNAKAMAELEEIAKHLKIIWKIGDTVPDDIVSSWRAIGEYLAMVADRNR